MTARIVTTRTRKVYGPGWSTLYSVSCRTCPSHLTRKVYGPGWSTLYSVSCRTCPSHLCDTWERHEARQVARQHARGHRRGRG